MEIREHAVAQPAELPLRPQDEVECRRCDVHCDKVVYPASCVERACPFVYLYEEFGHTYMGCVMKVFEVEIDFDLLRAAEARRGRTRSRRGADEEATEALREGYEGSCKGAMRHRLRCRLEDVRAQPARTC